MEKLESAIPMVISLKGIEKEILLTQANLLLSRPLSTTAHLYDARLIIPELSAIGHYEVAFTLGSVFKLDLSTIFSTYTSQLLSLYILPPHTADEMYVKSTYQE